MTRTKTDTNSSRSSSVASVRRPMDPDTPVRYIRENFEPEDHIAMVLIQKETHRVVQRIGTAEKVASPEFQAWLRHQNASRFEVYVSMNALKDGSRSRTKDDVAEIRHVYLDFDDNGTAAVQALLRRGNVPQPNYLVNSSSDKWQVVWKVEGFVQDEAERLMRHLVRDTGADPAATDSSRVLRLPGFVNHKYARPFVVTVESRSADTYRPEHFPAIPTEEQGGRQVTGHGPTREPRCVGETSQSERDWAYARRALARGESPDKVRAAIAAFRTGQKSDVNQYAERTVRKATKSLESDRAVGSGPEIQTAR
jgi:hypothetical protein